MKALRLKRMILLCEKERSARLIEFHSKVTLITGNNDTGKSSVIKSIYEAFGCDVENTTNWSKLDVVSCVEFETSGKDYTIIYSKKPKWYFLSPKDDFEKGQLCTSVTKELSLLLAELFDFRLELTTKAGVRTKALPAFIFMPFYIDQDKGWIKTFNSFERTELFDDWKVDMIDYYVGRKEPAYFPLKTEKINLEFALMEKKQKYQAEREVLEDFSHSLQSQDVEINLEDFRVEIQVLENQLNDLLSRRATLRVQLGEHTRRLSLVENELRIASKIIHEIGQDYEFSVQLTSNDGLDCPTCGAHYENDLINRFRLIDDHQKAQGVLEKLGQEQEELRQTEEALRTQVFKLDNEYTALDQSLRSSRQAVSVRQVFEERARKEVEIKVQKRTETRFNELAADQVRIVEKESELDSLVNRERSIEVLEAYRNHIQQAMERLHVNNYSDSVLKRLNAAVKGSGSDQPRALLAYTGAILQCIKDNPSSAMMPLVIDSPKQQDQDSANEVRMFEFIRDSLGTGDQLVLGSVNIPPGVNFGDHSVIHFSDKLKVLRTEEYENATSVLSPILEEARRRFTRLLKN